MFRSGKAYIFSFPHDPRASLPLDAALPVGAHRRGRATAEVPTENAQQHNLRQFALHGQFQLSEAAVGVQSHAQVPLRPGVHAEYSTGWFQGAVQ